MTEKKRDESEELAVREMGKMAYGALLTAGREKGLFLEFCRDKDSRKLLPVIMMVLGETPEGGAQVQPIAVLDLNLLEKVEPPADAVLETHCHETDQSLN